MRVVAAVGRFVKGALKRGAGCLLALSLLPYLAAIMKGATRRQILDKLDFVAKNPVPSWRAVRMFLLTRNRPLYLKVETINVCNAHCVFCSYDVMERKPKVLGLDIFEKVIREYSEMGGGAVTLTPGPGDFLLDPHLIRRYEIMGKYKNIDQISFTTNGIGFAKFSDEQLKFILRSSYMIQFSIGSLDRETYKRLYQVDQLENVLGSLTRVLDMKQAMDDDVHIHLAFRTDDPGYLQTARQQLEAFQNKGCLLSNLSTYNNFGGIMSSGEAKTKGISMRDGDQWDKTELCVYPLLMHSILSNGLITSCGCVDANGDALIIGDAAKNTLRDAWRSERRQMVLKAFSRKKLCELCRKCSTYRGFTHFASPIFKDVRAHQKLPLDFYKIYGG